MLPKNSRLTLPSDFYKLKKFGKRVSNKYFSIAFLKDSFLEKAQYSVIVSKAIAKKSTQRNKLKRVSRALIIKNLSVLPQNIKCLVFPKTNILTTKNKIIEVEFLDLLSQIEK